MLFLPYYAKVTQCAFAINSLNFIIMADIKYMQIQLVDANTGEIIYTTNNSAISSSSYLRQKMNRNIDSFVNYVRDTPGRDLLLQIIVREQQKPLTFPFKEYNDLF